MFALLSLIPGVASVAEGISKAWFDTKVRLVTARIGGDRDVAVSLVEAAAKQEHENTNKLSIIASNKFLTILLITAAIPLVGYEWKVIVWDTMLGLGSTPAVKGQVAEWGNTVWYFLFGTPAIMSLGKMWFSRDKTGQ